MKKSFCILSLLGLLFCGSHAYCDKTHECKTVSDTSIISRNYLGIIEESDSLVWYLLDPMSEDTTAVKVNDMGEILNCQTDTVEERCNALKATLTYPQSFVKSDMVKECTFLPDVAVRFYSKNGMVTFSYSFYCDVCRFERDGKYQDADGELIRKTIIQMASEAFPKDRYLRNIKRREK